MLKKNSMKPTVAYTSYFSIACLSMALQDHYILFVVLSSAMFIDTFFWFLKSIRIGTMQSRRLGWGILSKFTILAFILFLSAVSNQAFPEILWDQNIVHGIMWILVVAEVISMVQNLIVIKTWEHIEEFDAVTKALKFILATFRNTFEVKMK